MQHSEYFGNHSEAGYRWGAMLLENGSRIAEAGAFATVTTARREFARSCVPLYECFFPEALEEMRGLAEGQKLPFDDLCGFLLGMYCFALSPHCTCFAFHNDKQTVLARNSDFLAAMENLAMNCRYHLDGAFHFNGNTTAFIQMEDGVNDHGLAVGLTFIYPKVIRPGLNSGMLVRYLLEKCVTVREAVEHLRELPIASQQTLTLADRFGSIAVVECNCERVEVVEPVDGFVVATNGFRTPGMAPYQCERLDDWRSDERYETARNTLRQNKGRFSAELAKEILSGKHGFMCQYDRNPADTLWSVVYDLNSSQIYRAEGNPSRKEFIEDPAEKSNA